MDNVIMYEVLSELKDIAARDHGITCACGSGLCRCTSELRFSGLISICIPSYYFSNGTMANVLPKGASIFKIVLILGIEVPFSILAITGCFTPLKSSNCF